MKIERRRFLISASYGAAGALSLRSPTLAYAGFARRSEASTAPAAGRIAQGLSPPEVLSGVRLELQQATIPGDRPVEVWADEVICSEAIATNGHSIQIVARRLVLGTESQFDLQGPLAEPTYPVDSRAADGPTFSAHGSDGDNGADGPKSGSILVIANEVIGQLRVNARGRDGGNGQSGGNGAHGARPPKARACSTGSTGNSGGNAGSGGTGGRGGDGGTVRVLIMTALAHAPIIDAEGGAAGTAGKGGQPGRGSEGGQGGDASYHFEEPRR